MRSIEPLSYAIIDTNHPLQGGKTDSLHNAKAVLDTIPYSRVFYHVFPGAIIRHRGKKYKIISMSSPPAVLESFGTWKSSKLNAFAEPTTVRYFTQALALTNITIVKRFEFVDASRNVVGSITEEKRNKNIKTKARNMTHAITSEETKTTGNINNQEAVNGDEDSNANFDYNMKEDKKDSTIESLAGNGVVNIKRTVHGYAKLSPITRSEISRHEIRMPPMEYDTNALWLDADASAIVGTILTQEEYDFGVHALSHAILAVAPCFVPGCTSQDLDCDHGYRCCTRVLIFDLRAGGAGLCAQLWKHVFCQKGILHAALDLLEDCPTCNGPIETETESSKSSKVRDSYDGGCPSCIQSGPCMNFNQGLSRHAGLLIGKRMLKRVEQTSLYKNSCTIIENEHRQTAAISSPNINSPEYLCNVVDLTPRKRKRKKKFQDAYDLDSAQKRHIVVGRPSWPTDQNHGGTNDDDPHEMENVNLKYVGNDEDFTEAGGFIKS